MIHVLGLGRSGTHALHKLLCTNPHLECIKAETLLFQESIKTALYSENVPNYVKELNRVTHHTFKVIKNHVEMWFWGSIPMNHRGILIERDMRDYLASSLNHNGTLQWVRNFDHYPANGLSGTLSNIPRFGDLSIIERLVIKKRYAENFTNVLLASYQNIMVLPYRLMVNDTATATDIISDFLKIPNVFDAGVIKNVPSKYANLPKLTKQEIEIAIEKWS